MELLIQPECPHFLDLIPVAFEAAPTGRCTGAPGGQVSPTEQPQKVIHTPELARNWDKAFQRDCYKRGQEQNCAQNILTLLSRDLAFY